MKQGYAGAQQALAPDDAGSTAAPATGAPASAPASAPAAQPTPGAPSAAPAGQPAPQGSPAPQGGAAGGNTPEPQPAPGADLDQLKASIGKLNPDQKKELAGELEKSINTPPAQQAEPAAPEAEKPEIGRAHV